MRNLPWVPPGGGAPVGDAACEALLAGRLPPADAEAGLRPLAEAVAALTMVPSARELAGEPGARAVYQAGFRPPPGGRGHLRRTRLLASLLSVKLAAAAAVAAGGLTAAAAYADVLPAPVQSFAHRTLRAPAPHLHPGLVPGPGPGRPVTPSGLAPAGPAAHGRPGSRSGQPSAASSRSPAGTASGTPASHPSHPSHSQHSGHPSHPPHPGHPSHPAGQAPPGA